MFPIGNIFLCSAPRPMTPPPIAALLFDLGNVLLEIDFRRALAHWAPFSALTPEALRKTFGPDAAYQRHERGELEATEYFDHLRKKLKLNASDAQIEAGWNAIFVGEISATVETVRSTALPRHVLTNTNHTHQRYWNARFAHTLTGFDRLFSSAAMGHRKPERKAFEHVAQALKLNPERILFFDDLAENIAGARAAGLQAIHVRTPQDVKDALARLG